MAKPNKTFKLSKTSKRMIALMKGCTAEQRNQFKRMMIDAQVCSEIVVKSAPRDKNAPRGAPGVAGTTGSHAYTTTPAVE